MARIIDCTLPQSNIHYEEIVTINVDKQHSFPMDEPQFVSRNDELVDLNMQINDKTELNFEISKSEINEDFQELKKGMNIVENANLKQVTVNTSDSDKNESSLKLNGMNIVEHAILKDDLVTMNMETSDSEINEGLRELNRMNIVDSANLKGLAPVFKVNMETSDNEINEDLQEFNGMNVVESANVRRALVAALSSGICDDISRFNREQEGLFNVQWSQVDNQPCTDGSVKCESDANADIKESLHPFAKVKVEESSFSLAKVKIESNLFPFTNIKTENDTSDMITAYSLKAETTLESQVELQPSDDLGQHTGSAPTVIKKEPGGDNAETDYDQTEGNGLQRLKMNSLKVCKVLMSHKNVLSSPVPNHVALATSVTSTDPFWKRMQFTDGSAPQAKVPKEMMQNKATSKMAISQKHCIVCNSPCFITENRKLPKLPFCVKCKKAYSYQRSRRYASKRSICPSGGACRIDYRQQKMCSRCHYAKFLAVMSAAHRAFKENFKLQISSQYRHKEVVKQKKHDWSIIRDEFLLQEALVFQPQVLLKRIDDCTSLHSASKVQLYRTTSPIHGGNVNTASKTANTDPAVFDDMDVEEAQTEIPSYASSGCLSESVEKTKIASARKSLVKVMLNQDGGNVADRLVSRYSGRVIRPINFDIYGHDTFHPVAKRQHSATKLRKKSAYNPSKVSVFMCGHVCGVCNNKDTIKWLRDHGHSKTQPLSHALCGETQQIMKDGTFLNAALILNKLFELNELLRGSSNLCLELKNRQLQHESLSGTSMPSVNLPVGYPTLPNSSDVLMQESSTHKVSHNTLLPESTMHEVVSGTAKAPLSKKSFFNIKSDTINISLPKGSAWTSSSDTINITLPKGSCKISSDLVNTSQSKNSANTSRLPHKMSSCAINTSISKSSTHEISRDAVKISLLDSHTLEISRDGVKTSLPQSAAHEISSDVIKPLPSKCSTQEITNDAVKTSLPKSSVHKTSTDVMKSLLSKSSTHEITNDATNPSLPKSSVPKISRDAVKTSLPKTHVISTLKYQISNSKIKPFPPKCSTQTISSGTTNASISTSLTHEYSNGTMSALLSKLANNEVSSSAVYSCHSEMSALQHSRHILKTALINHRRKLSKNVVKLLPLNIPPHAIATGLPNTHTNTSQQASQHRQRLITSPNAPYELSNDVFKVLPPKIPVHTVATGLPNPQNNTFLQSSQHQLLVSPPNAPQPVMYVLLPVSTDRQQFPILLPKSFQIQPADRTKNPA